MQTQETTTQEHREAIETTVKAAMDYQSAASTGYQNSAVSASCSVGPDGANMQGWITYTESGKKIHFNLKGKPTSSYGLFAGVGAAALIGALPPEQLAGKVGTFIASGWGGGGQLCLYLDGKPTLTTCLPMVGTGLFGWRIEGHVAYEVRD